MQPSATSRPRGYVVCWTALFLLHALNVAYYICVALIYSSFQLSFVYLQLKLLTIGIDNSQYVKVAVVHALLAVIHATFLVFMLVGSFQARELVFLPRYLSAASHKRRDLDALQGRSSRCLSRTLGRAARVLVARDGPLGVDCVYFDHIILAREILETALQTHQLYRMTQLLPRLWFIRSYVMLLVVNCWALPLLHRWYRRHPIQRRTICLLCDAVLDMTSSMGVSLVIFVTYLKQYDDPNGFGFPYTNWFQDQWLANMQQEFQIMLVASWGDLLARVCFAIGLLMCMDSIKDMVTPVPVQAKEQRKVEPQPTVASIVPAKTGSVLQVHHRSRGTFVVHTLGPLIFLLWGAVIVVVHGFAESIHTDSPCSLLIRPWLSSKPGCSLVQLDCHDLHSSGDDDAMLSAWNVFDPERTARLAIRHCPRLQITTRLLQYRYISGLKIYNSTLTSWPDHAAVTATLHPLLRSVTIVRTNFPNGEIPPGLLSQEFPQGLSSFITSTTNLRALPDDLDTKWPRGMRLILEYSQLTEIPDVVIRLRAADISIAGSPIRSIPPEVFEIDGLVSVIAGDTLLQELPQNVTNPSSALYVLFLQNTNVSTFWAWMDGFVQFTLHFPTKLFKAHGTPYCQELAQIVQGTRKAFSAAVSVHTAAIMDVSTPEGLALATRAVDCEPGFPTHFPLGFEDALHALH